MAAANYPVNMVRGVMAETSRAYGLDHQFLALPNQSFPLAQLVARAPTGTISPADGIAHLNRIRNQRSRFPAWVAIIGYAAQSTGLAVILQPTPWSLIGAAFLGLMVGALAAVG